MAEAFLTENLPEATFGAPKAGAGMWASCIRLINPIDGRTIQVKKTCMRTQLDISQILHKC